MCRFRLCGKENRIRANSEPVGFVDGTARSNPALPNNLVAQVVHAKNLGKYLVHVATYPVVAMHIDARILMHQIAHEDKALVNHGDEGIRAASPGVAVGDCSSRFGSLWNVSPPISMSMLKSAPTSNGGSM